MSQQLHKIIHIDMDAFYASIEQRDNPELRGKPVIVGGHPDKRGVVATCSYEARRFGVHSAMPSRTAFKLCPQGIYVPPRFDVYRAVSTQIMQIFRSYTDLVEPLSLDEAYLDVTENKPGQSSPGLIAREIKQQIYAQTGLTASAGVSFNKFIAKLASDYRKPDGLTIVTPANAGRFLEAIPINKFFGVGRVTEARLKQEGIASGADLKKRGEEELRVLFGERGTLLYRYALGEDDRPVQPTRIRKSVGKETTLFEDIDDREQMIQILERLARQVEQRLHDLDLQGKTVTLKLKWADFQQITRSITLASPIQNASEMMIYIHQALAHLSEETRQVRLLGVTVSNLSSTSELARLPEFLPRSLWD
jgi:DNA polymerase-4